MTELSIKVAAFGLLAGGLAACASTPEYPVVRADTSAPAPAGSPVSGPVPLSQPSSESASLPPAPAQAPPAAVASQPLAPVEAPRETAAPTATQSAPAPPPAHYTPPAAPRAEPVRYIATGKVIPARSMYRDYEVRKGDHLDAIARDLQTTRAVLIEANHLKDPDSLRPGQHLRVPIEKAYAVEPGDTISAVARRFEVSPADLADLNAMSESQRLRRGDLLALPAVFHDRGPVAAPPTRVAARYTPSTPYRSGAWSATSAPAYGARAYTPYPGASAAATPSLSDTEVAAAGRGRFVWPVRGEILAPFGVQDLGRRNDGLDVKAPQGAEVRAAAAGDVVYAGDQVPGFGNLVLVKHADGWVTAYAHLDRVLVKMRDSVAQDQEIGVVGQSGGVSEPQLHFEIRYAPSPLEKAKPIDPMLVLPK